MWEAVCLLGLRRRLADCAAGSAAGAGSGGWDCAWGLGLGGTWCLGVGLGAD
ncbi:hypothetical protein HOK021_39170 [Streptomyces hygroscopicus]|nr:hypothetical protein HOK021_39170 [Streptomyces hygroscopicus]